MHSRLSKIALDWMLQEAKAAGLMVDDAKEKQVLGVSSTRSFVLPDAQAKADESLTSWWNLAEFV
jgi:hypothetical protein